MVMEKACSVLRGGVSVKCILLKKQYTSIMVNLDNFESFGFNCSLTLFHLLLSFVSFCLKVF